jgi:hypothetical protein
MSTTACFISDRIKQVEQPEGGYIPPETLKVEPVDEDVDTLNPEENVSPYLINSAVNYMARFMMGGMPAQYIFGHPVSVARRIGGDALAFKARDLATTIKGLDDESIINAVKLSGFDACFFADSESCQPIEEINPDEATIQNVRTMVERSLRFRVDADVPKWSMPETLWGINVSKSCPTQAQTLPLLIDLFEGLCSSQAFLFHNIKYLGIYNPRLNEFYWISVDGIPRNVLAEVDQDLIEPLVLER